MELLFLNLCSVQLLKPRERESHLGTKPAACSAPALLLASLRRGAQVSELEVPWHVGKVDHHWVTDTMRDAWLKQPGMQNEHILVENGDSHIYQTEKFSSKKNHTTSCRWGYYLQLLFELFFNTTSSGRNACMFFPNWPNWVAPPRPWLSILQTRNSMIVWQMRMMENHHGCCNHMTLVIISS
jgi:hypothetical protein